MANPMEGRGRLGFKPLLVAGGSKRKYFEYNNHSGTQGELLILLLNHLMMCGLNIRTGNSGETYFEKQISTKISRALSPTS